MCAAVQLISAETNGKLFATVRELDESMGRANAGRWKNTQFIDCVDCACSVSVDALDRQ